MWWCCDDVVVMWWCCLWFEKIYLPLLLDCPIFSVVYDDPANSVQYRTYEAGYWARTQVIGIDYQSAVTTGFDRLFDYISGANTQNVTIEMTSPVSTQVVYAQGPFCGTTFIVSFYCPYIYQPPNSNPPPTPTDPTVYVELMNQTTRAVYSFGGYLVGFQPWVQPSQFLYQYVTQKGDSVNESYEFTNVYDSPFQPIKRHNEVWYDLIEDSMV